MIIFCIINVCEREVSYSFVNLYFHFLNPKYKEHNIRELKFSIQCIEQLIVNTFTNEHTTEQTRQINSERLWKKLTPAQFYSEHERQIWTQVAKMWYLWVTVVNRVTACIPRGTAVVIVVCTTTRWGSCTIMDPPW